MSTATTEVEPIILLPPASMDAIARERLPDGRELDLSGRWLEDAPPKEEEEEATVPVPSSVTTLDLSRNIIMKMSEFNLTQFENLVELNLSSNRLKDLPRVVCRLRKLQNLSVKQNSLTSASFPDEFGAMASLRHFNVSGNNLEALPDVLFRLTSLESLHVGGNAITTVPSAISQLHRLQHLYLGGNRLTRVPEEIGSLTRLQSLALCDNQLVELPDAIVSLSELKSLQLHSNQLQALPRALLELDSIMSLSLRKNPLVARFVREMVFNMPSLQEQCGRAVRSYGLRYRGVVPPHLERYLDTARHCDNPKCLGVYFESSIQTVKFSDFCGKYHVPFQHYLCSSDCSADLASSPSPSPLSSPGEDVEGDTVALSRMQKVLLG